MALKSIRSISFNKIQEFFVLLNYIIAGKNGKSCKFFLFTQHEKSFGKQAKAWPVYQNIGKIKSLKKD